MRINCSSIKLFGDKQKVICC